MIKVGKSGRNASWTVVRDAIAAGESFGNAPGSFRGGPKSSGIVSGPLRSVRVGSLPLDYSDSFTMADYAVWSYRTPIAWRTAGEWVTPDIHYSVTTSCHQGKVNTAVSQL